jgi:hypothetical protein
MTQLPLSPEKPAIQRKQLTARESFILTNYVGEHYVSSKMTDVEFAKLAGPFLKIERLGPRHISTARETLDIPSNRDLARMEKDRRTESHDPVDLTPIEKRLDTLEAQVRKLFALSDESRVTVKIPSDAQIIRIRDELYRTHSAESGDFRAIELVRRVLRGEF